MVAHVRGGRNSVATGNSKLQEETVNWYDLAVEVTELDEEEWEETA